MVSKQTQAKIDALKEEIAKIEATAYREDLVTAVRKNDSDENLYVVAKGFTNHLERQRKIANLEEARKAKEAIKSPVSS